MIKQTLITALFFSLVGPMVWADAKIQRLNPDGMAQPAGYRQVVTANGGKMVFLAGQAGLRADYSMPESLAEQAELTYENIRIALAAVGGSAADVVRITVYIVGLGQGTDPTPVYEAQGKFFPADAFADLFSFLQLSLLSLFATLLQLLLGVHPFLPAVLTEFVEHY